MDELVSVVRSLADKLKKQSKTFATAESCTGGWMSKTVTDVGGVSAVFLGGVVSYANEVKEKLLGVKSETLASYGAVSEQTAREMALGCVAATGADYAVAVTGIAGPTGGTPEKPVGLVFIGAASKDGRVYVEKNLFSGDRNSVRLSTVKKALAVLSDFVDK